MSLETCLLLGILYGGIAIGFPEPQAFGSHCKEEGRIFAWRGKRKPESSAAGRLLVPLLGM